MQSLKKLLFKITITIVNNHNKNNSNNNNNNNNNKVNIKHISLIILTAHFFP